MLVSKRFLSSALNSIKLWLFERCGNVGFDTTWIYMEHYGAAIFSWAFRQLCKPKQILNNFILVPMKASTVLGTLQFAPDSFLELSNHQNLSQTSRNKRLNESQWVLMSVNETHQDSLRLTKTLWASPRLIKTLWERMTLLPKYLMQLITLNKNTTKIRIEIFNELVNRYFLQNILFKYTIKPFLFHSVHSKLRLSVDSSHLSLDSEQCSCLGSYS